MASEDAGFLIVYGSQTGQAKAIAQDIHKDALAASLPARLYCMDQFKEFNLSNEKLVVCICSTTGEGDAPDNASRFWRRLKATSLSSTYLAGLNFTVLGLGDSNYSNFCNMGKQLDKRFAELGATRFYNAGFADDGVGLELVVEPWREGLFAAIKKAMAQSTAQPTTDASSKDAAPIVVEPTPAADSAPAPAPKQYKLPKLSEAFLDIVYGESTTEAPTTAGAAPVPAPSSPAYQIARIASYRCLTAPDAVKRTVEVVVDLTATSLQGYLPGDAFGVACPNIPHEVQSLIEALGAQETADKPFTLQYTGPATAVKKSASSAPTVPEHLQGSLTLRQALSSACDIRAFPKKAFVRVLAEYATDANEKDALLFLCSQDGGDKYREECKSGSFTLERLLRAHPSCKVPVARVLENLMPLQPRCYSVCSSPLTDPNKVCFVFNIEGAHPGAPLPGICTTWLESKLLSFQKAADTDTRDVLLARETRNAWMERASSGEFDAVLDQLKALSINQSSPLAFRLQAHNAKDPSLVPLYLRPHLGFTPPEDTSKPLIMIGPGTGVAPFVGFLRHRREQRRANPSATYGPTLLFFGCRNKAKDYLFEDELTSFLADGTLTRLYAAFSRDEGSTHKYVQDHFKDVPDLGQLLLKEQAHVFACGSIAAMGVQLDEAIKAVLTRSGLTAPGEVDTIFSIWRQDGRFKKELWG